MSLFANLPRIFYADDDNKKGILVTDVLPTNPYDKMLIIDISLDFPRLLVFDAENDEWKEQKVSASIGNAIEVAFNNVNTDLQGNNVQVVIEELDSLIKDINIKIKEINDIKVDVVGRSTALDKPKGDDKE